MEKKKVLVPTIIAIAVLIVMTVGATFAYFTFNSQNDFETVNIEANTGALGSGVSLKKAENADLTLNVSATDMLVDNAGSYYASGSSTPKTIATIAVAGAGKFNCTYAIEITKTSTEGKDLYTKFQSAALGEGQVYINLNEKTYDFATANLFDNNGKITYNGTVTGITSAANTDITANLTIVNSASVDQTAINDSDIKLSFSATAFNCTLVEE